MRNGAACEDHQSITLFPGAITQAAFAVAPKFVFAVERGGLGLWAFVFGKTKRAALPQNRPSRCDPTELAGIAMGDNDT